MKEEEAGEETECIQRALLPCNAMDGDSSLAVKGNICT